MKRLVLAGGGHAHLHVLKALAAQRWPGVEVWLVTPYLRQIYSGMVPGWMAGHYALDQCAAPLEPLARAAGVRVRQEPVTGIDAARREAVRDEVARVLWQTRSQHIIVRSSPHEDVAVTIVGRSADGDGEETVDLWHEVPRVGDES